MRNHNRCNPIPFNVQRPDYLQFDFADVIVSIGTSEDYFPGPYTVIPRVVKQTLATKDKVMTNNLVIEKIPITYTDNATGITATIG